MIIKRPFDIFRFARIDCTPIFATRLRIWWNWQTRYFEVVVPQGVEVQVLLCAPIFLRIEEEDSSFSGRSVASHGLRAELRHDAE